MRESRALTTNALDTMSAAWACLPIGNLREAGCHFRTGAVALMLEEDESALPALRSHVLSPAPEVAIVVGGPAQAQAHAGRLAGVGQVA